MSKLVLKHFNDEFMKFPPLILRKVHGRWVRDVNGEPVAIGNRIGGARVKTAGTVEVTFTCHPGGDEPNRWLRVKYNGTDGGIYSMQEVFFEDQRCGIKETHTTDIDAVEISFHCEHSGMFGYRNTVQATICAQ